MRPRRADERPAAYALSQGNLLGSSAQHFPHGHEWTARHARLRHVIHGYVYVSP